MAWLTSAHSFASSIKRSDRAEVKLAFHHIGVVTKELRACADFYVRLGYVASAVIDDPIQKVSIVLCTRDGHPMIELVSPTSEESPASGWLTRIKAGPYHTCYAVPDLEKAIGELSELGARALSEPVPAVAFEGRRVVFLWGAESGLMELVETNVAP